MLSNNLGLRLGVRNMKPRVYSEAIAQYRIDLSLIPFQYNFPDPHNLLGMVWHSQPVGVGRHDWMNAEFDRLVDEAARETDEVRHFEM